MKEDIRSLEAALASAKERLSRTIAALAPKHQGGEKEEYESARAELTSAERRLGAAKDEPYAIPADFPIAWDTGAPLPILLRGESRTFLIFLVDEPDPDWDGTYVTIIDPAPPEATKLCIVTIEGCISAKLGSPNDEVLHGHLSTVEDRKPTLPRS
jgi:hypothetical protein